jgi:hypothetical protein
MQIFSLSTTTHASTNNKQEKRKCMYLSHQGKVAISQSFPSVDQFDAHNSDVPSKWLLLLISTHVPEEELEITQEVNYNKI